jgi:hypothetical protein
VGLGEWHAAAAYAQRPRPGGLVADRAAVLASVVSPVLGRGRGTGTRTRTRTRGALH